MVNATKRGWHTRKIFINSAHQYELSVRIVNRRNKYIHAGINSVIPFDKKLYIYDLFTCQHKKNRILKRVDGWEYLDRDTEHARDIGNGYDCSTHPGTPSIHPPTHPLLRSHHYVLCGVILPVRHYDTAVVVDIMYPTVYSSICADNNIISDAFNIPPAYA